MRYLIIGGVAGGASAAARLRRLDEKAEIILFEKGEYISYANCGLPYYIGDIIKDRNKLFVQTPASFGTRFNIDVRTRAEVVAVNVETKTIAVHYLENGNTEEIHYDKLVLSPGAEPIRPPLSGIDLEGIFTLRNVADTDNIKSYAKLYPKGKAVVIGGGFIGLEMAENFHHLGMDVTIVEMSPQVMAPADFAIAAIAQQHIRSKGVQLFLNTAVTGFEKEGQQVKVLLKDRGTLTADIVILSIGVRPDTKLATMAGLAIGEARGIKVNEYLQTSNPDIYALGDAIEFENPITGKSMPTYLAGPANKQGRICANNIVNGNNHIYDGSINTAIVKIFDMTVAVAGMASKHLKAANITHITSTTHSGSHAGYYPHAETLTIQLNVEPDTGKLLGAQVIGGDGVDKRIDVLSYLISKGGTIDDLTTFEHAYAPPYSSAKDPVNMAGFVIENILSNKSEVIYWDEIEKLPKSTVCIDVRTHQEVAKGAIPGAINITVDDLRKKLKDISKESNIVVYCQVGLRGYLAQRILVQEGYKSVRNLSGGYKTWSNSIAELNA
jgi:NADPH-dependent 2,4-dienoyl-CoA reductase/sulfur reductase-like enzyme/rhodanese-related sulfurtransferase